MNKEIKIFQIFLLGTKYEEKKTKKERKKNDYYLGQKPVRLIFEFLNVWMSVDVFIFENIETRRREATKEHQKQSGKEKRKEKRKEERKRQRKKQKRKWNRHPSGILPLKPQTQNNPLPPQPQQQLPPTTTITTTTTPPLHLPSPLLPTTPTPPTSQKKEKVEIEEEEEEEREK